MTTRRRGAAVQAHQLLTRFRERAPGYDRENKFFQEEGLEPELVKSEWIALREGNIPDAVAKLAAAEEQRKITRLRLEKLVL